MQHGRPLSEWVLKSHQDQSIRLGRSASPIYGFSPARVTRPCSQSASFSTSNQVTVRDALEARLTVGQLFLRAHRGDQGSKLRRNHATASPSDAINRRFDNGAAQMQLLSCQRAWFGMNTGWIRRRKLHRTLENPSILRTMPSSSRCPDTESRCLAYHLDQKTGAL